MVNDTNRISIICAQVSAAEAIEIAAAAGDVSGVRGATCIHYPYYWYRAQGSAPGLFGRRSLTLDCLVDARSGIASTTDRFTIEERRPADSVQLAPDRSADIARAAAQRCLAHSLGRRLRTIADFQLNLDDRGLVYKTYWVVDCAGEDLLVDSGNGAFHPLQAA
jgi:hypothetical protein